MEGERGVAWGEKGGEGTECSGGERQGQPSYFSAHLPHRSYGTLPWFSLPQPQPPTDSVRYMRLRHNDLLVSLMDE